MQVTCRAWDRAGPPVFTAHACRGQGAPLCPQAALTLAYLGPSALAFPLVPAKPSSLPFLRCLSSHPLMYNLGFPGGSAGKETACSTGDPGFIPGPGRSPGEGTGYPLQDSWTSLVAQMVKNSPAMQETWVSSLGREDPLEEGMATHSRILAWRIPWREGLVAAVHGVTKSQTRLSDSALTHTE